MRTDKRRVVSLAVAALLVLCLAVTLFAACDKGDELPADVPVSWEKYLTEAAERIADGIALDGGRIGMKLTAHAVTDSGGYDFLFGMNYDTADSAGSCIVIEVKRASGARGDAEAAAEDVLFSLVADDSSTWIDIAPGLAVSDARLKVENVNIFDLLGVVYNEENEDAAREAFAGIVFNLGKAFFSGARPDGDADIYTFVVDSGYKETGREYFDAVLGVFGDEVASALLAAFGLGSPDELFDLLPDMSGEVTLTFDGEGGAAFSADGLTVGDGGAEFDAVFDVQSEFYAELTAKVPDGDAAGYVVTKVGNSHMEGQLSLMQGGGALVTYDYVLDANLDLLTLISADYDLGALGDDNYFHLRVSHTCSAACGEFCRTRYAEAGGSVFDLAFSPSDFNGSHNIYMSVAVQNLFSDDKVDEIADSTGLLSGLIMPEYTLITYPCEKFYEGSSVCSLLTALYACNIFSDDTVSFDLTDAEGLIGLLSGLADGGDSFVPDALLFEIEENSFGMAQDHDIYAQTVYIIDSGIGDVKDYGPFRTSLALSWEWEEFAQTVYGGGEVSLTNIYIDENTLLHGVSDDGGYVPVSPEELERTAGQYYVKAHCTGLDLATRFDTLARVVELKDVDYSSRSVQEITMVVEYPNPLRTAILTGGTEEYSENLTVEVKARVLLTGRTSADVIFTPRVASDAELYIISADAPGIGGLYSGFNTAVPEYLYADARVEYDNGYVKEMLLTGECDGIGIRDMVIFDDYYYSSEVGDVTVQWSFLDGEYSRTYRIQAPDRVEFDIDVDSMPSHGVGSTVYMPTITNYIDAVAYYDNADGTVKGITLYLTADNLFINDIPLSESSSYWTSSRPTQSSYTVVFHVAADYECRAEIFGFESESFTQRVTSDLGEAATYAFGQSSSTPNFWFTGTEYTFAGYLSNATHGYNDDFARTLTVAVSRYDSAHASYPETLDLSAEDSPVSLTSFTADGCFSPSGEPGVLETSQFPALIVDPVYTSFRLVFNEPGYYRVSLRLSGRGGFTNYWYITVAE
ncbi:MAG TPA: hypothetical protein IAC16_04225 [Candidatus Limadaptatus stercoravium]|nr:hypothetical protein [Candidatus Limadaptatus stercoravium]